MRKLINKLITPRIKAIFYITLFVNLIMIYAAKQYIEPSVILTFHHVYGNVKNDATLSLMVNQPFNDRSLIVATVLTTIHTSHLTEVYVFIVTSISALLAFDLVLRLMKAFLHRSKHRLITNLDLTRRIKFVVMWIALYKFCNLAIELLALPDFIFKYITIVSQGVVFYLLLLKSNLHFELEKIENTEFHKDLKITIRPSILADIDEMVSLSKAKRLNYEKAQPQFWRYAGPEGDEAQRKWFKELLTHQDYLMLTATRHCEDSEAIQDSGSPRDHVARDDGVIVGFVIGRLIPAPEVYDPGGLTLMIDDFCVRSENLWESAGLQLTLAIKALAKERGASQILVLCGAHDEPKRKFLKEQNLSIASEWFVCDIS